jgi:hypothetical protein
MTTQAVRPNSDESFHLTFLDENGNAIAGPMGAVSSTASQVSPWLSADGQSVNFRSVAAGVDFTITWHDPSGTVADITGHFVTRAVVGSFGTVANGFTL